MPSNKGAWDAVPIGVRLTPDEVAKIVGITRDSVTNRFCPAQRRPMPQGFRLVAINSRIHLIIRDS